MDGRKLIRLTGALLFGLVGCTKPVTNSGLPQTPPPPPKPAKTEPSPDTVITKRDKLGEPKQSWLQMAALKAELATDPKRPANEREAFAQQAKDTYGKALKVDPKCVVAYMGLGNLNESMGDREEALKNYYSVLKVDAKNVTAHVAAARVLEGAGQRDDALATYAAATTSMPREAALWYEMGMCYGRAKQFDPALECLLKASELRPKYPDYSKTVGFMLARMDRPDEALPWLTKSMPEADARYQLAQIMRHIGRDDAMREQLAVALKLEPDHTAALKLAAELTPTQSNPSAVRAASVRADDPPTSVQPASALPARPMVIETAGQLRSLPPVMPVIWDQGDDKRTPSPSLTGPAPKKVPIATVGFDANP